MGPGGLGGHLVVGLRDARVRRVAPTDGVQRGELDRVAEQLAVHLGWGEGEGEG